MFSSLSVIAGEMKPGVGEDDFSWCIHDQGGMIAAVDGCGGRGSKRYAKYSNMTGAYIGARAVSKCMRDWYDMCVDRQELIVTQTGLEELKRGTEKYLYELNAWCEEDAPQTGLKGAMAGEALPSVLSAAVFSWRKAVCECTYLWAGDARGYLLTGSGLVQITEDDNSDHVFGGDSMLTNTISADKKLQIHHRNVRFSEPGLIVVATDGCYGYFGAEVEFEYALLTTLEEAQSIAQWERAVYERIVQVAGDDFTMLLVCVGCHTFAQMQQVFRGRCTELYERYIKRIELVQDDETLAELDQQYAREIGRR